MMTFTVAIVGRPNVGKSTLFNRLCGLRVALVDPTPGVTRDRRYGDATLADISFRIIDTAGLDEPDGAGFEEGMQRQTMVALEEADAALFLIDARAGVTPLDKHFSDILRRSPVPVILVANKCEGKAAEAGMYEAFGLGFGDPVPISAEHAEGMINLYEVLAPLVDQYEQEQAAAKKVVPEEAPESETDEIVGDEDDPQRALQLAIVGRPNVGKSTLLNRLIGEDRVLTGPEAGVTRDSIAVEWEFEGRPLTLVDTAGLRKRARVQEKLERLSVGDALRSIRFAQVVVLVMDATQLGDRQDFTIANHAIEEGRALMIAVNKWDVVEDRGAAMQRLRDRLETSLPQAKGIPIVTISALTGDGMRKLMQAVFDLYEIWNARVPTGPLNRWLEQMLDGHPPPLVQGRRLRLRYMTQVKTRPPSFVIFSTRPGEIPESYRRYLINGLRERFGLNGVPIRITLRKGDNPYAK